MDKEFYIMDMSNESGKSRTERPGDCFYIGMKNEQDECGILVDSHIGSYASVIETLINDGKRIDCIVITHCDDDHISGLLKLLKTKSQELENKEESKENIIEKLNDTVIIFNRVNSGNGTIHYGQAIELAELLAELKIRVIPSYSKNSILVIHKGMLHIQYAGKRKRHREGLKQAQKEEPYLTILHPGLEGIREVYTNFTNLLNRKKKTVKEMTSEDWRGGNPKIINKNSIAFLLEFADKKVLFTGDGYIDILSPTICGVLGENEKLDLIKIPHHGAEENNKGLATLAAKYRCSNFIVTGDRNWEEKSKHPAKKILQELECTKRNEPLKVYTSSDMTKYGNTKIFDRTEKIDLLREDKES